MRSHARVFALIAYMSGSVLASQVAPTQLHINFGSEPESMMSFTWSTAEASCTQVRYAEVGSSNFSVLNGSSIPFDAPSQFIHVVRIIVRSQHKFVPKMRQSIEADFATNNPPMCTGKCHRAQSRDQIHVLGWLLVWRHGLDVICVYVQDRV